MAIINTKPDMNMGIWAEGGNIEIPSDTKIDEGWVVEKPLNEYMNFVQNRQDRMLQYINQRGIPEWDLRTEYPVNAHVARAGKVYKALSQNTDADPLSNSSIWIVAFASYEEYLNLFNDVDLIKNEEGYLEKYVSKQNPQMDGDAIAKSYSFNSKPSAIIGVNEANYVSISEDGLETHRFKPVEDLTAPTKDVVTMDVLLQFIQTYKIGDLYLTTNSGNPSVLLGYGSWERYGEGRALVGVSTKTSDPDWTKGVSSLYGEYTHKQTIAELPPHKHGQGIVDTGVGRIEGYSGTAPQNDNFSLGETLSTGEGQPFNIVQPSITVFIWRRTA
jgi:hypothetical protein